MKELFIFQIEMAICLVVLSILYFLIWKKETNFLFKRILLLSIPVFSILIPLLDFKVNMASEQPAYDYLAYFPGQMIMQTGLSKMPQVESVSAWQIVSVLWILGVLFMLIRMAISYWKIWQIYKASEVSYKGNYRMINNPIQSFSFFKLIVINKSQAKTGSMDHILAHEQAHSRQYHSVDVVFFEIVKMLQWFNPFIWLITNESKQNLEFLADQSATVSDDNKEPYQYAIIHHAANSGYQLLKSQFSKANLKNRIIMMNQPKNRNIHKRKLLALLPIVLILMMSFSLKVENLDLKKEIAEAFPVFNSGISSIKEAISLPTVKKLDLQHNNNNAFNTILDESDTSHNKVFAIVEQQPYPSTGDMRSYLEIIEDDLNYPEAKAQNIKGKVFVEFIIQKDGTLRDVKVLRGISPECDLEAVRAVKEGPTWIPGEQRGQKVNVRLAMPIKFGYEEGDTRKLDGKIVTSDEDPVIGCNVIIKGTRTGTVSDGEGRFLIEVEDEHSELIFSYLGLISKTVSITEESNYDITLEFDPEYARSPDPQVNSGKVVVGRPLALKQGINIKLSTTLQDLEDDAQPLIIIDGKEIDEIKMSEIDPGEIHSISVLKDQPAVSVYGDKGANGVILITTKKAKSEDPVYTDVTIIDDNNEEGLKLKTDGNLDFGQENPPLFFIGEVEATQKEVEEIDKNSIESIEVIKGKAAKEKYGKKGKDGVVLIKMKK